MKRLFLFLGVCCSFSVARAQVLLDAPGPEARKQRAIPEMNERVRQPDLELRQANEIGLRLGKSRQRNAARNSLTDAEKKEAADLFVRAYLECRRAAAAVEAKDGNTAALAYVEAEGILLSLQKMYPTWQPEIVHNRRNQIAEAMIGPVAQLLPEYIQAAALCQRAVADYREGKWHAAIEKLSAALSLDIQNARAHLYLSLAASARGWDALAKRELHFARELDPDVERELDAVPPLGK